MASIRTKLFSTKNKKRKGGGRQILNDFKDLGKKFTGEADNNPNPNPNPNPSSSPNSNSTTYSVPKSKSNKFQELVNRYKTDPDFKKKVKTGGYITLGTALLAGAAIGGAKLIKNKKRKEENEKIKNQILPDDSNKKDKDKDTENKNK